MMWRFPMAKLTDIKFRIDQLDGGTFQTLCDVYLKCRGYGTGYSLGMNTGTSKTAKGNPDTYFLAADNKYVFVMYTTQKTDFVKKAFEDLQKCFDQGKTGVSPDNVVEIIYCHTYGRLSAGEDKMLRDFCESKDTKLTLVGLDELGEDLYLNYPRLAKDYLGISIDTGQITSPEEFVQSHDGNKMSAPLSTTFLFREDMVENAKNSLEKSNVLIISGPAGTGKTRLALQICETLSATNKYKVICIRSNGLELYEDLVAIVEEGKDYLVLVDDANELSGLRHVLNYLAKSPTKSPIKKIILTVRDYARQQVLSQVLEFERPEILKVGPLKDDDIKKLIQESYGITNTLYSDRIVAIAEGNPRLAMLAGKLASETETLDSIRDASELYEHYYGKQIESISNSETGTISMGIMAFFQVLHLDYLDRLSPIFAGAGIAKDRFISDLRHFHDMELVDLCHDKAARISDQSFSNYLIKYVFIDRKVIPLHQMIEICFSTNKERTISACNILLYVFSDVKIQEYIEQQIALVWDSLQSDSERFVPFFKAFHMIRPVDTLLLLKDQIEQETVHPFDLRSIEFKKNDGEKNISDNVINILCSFKNHSLLPEAIELLLLYYKKRPDLFEQVYSAFVSYFNADKSIINYGYFTPKTAVEQLCTEIQVNPSKENLFLFIRVSEQFLKLSFSRTEGGRQHTVTFYAMPLIYHEDVLAYRSMLLHQLYEIYKENSCCREEIESLLMDYCREHGENIDYEIVRQEFKYVLSFFSLFSIDSLYHCVIAKKIKNVAQHIEYDCEDTFSSFIDSPKYKIYDALRTHHEDLTHFSIERDYQQRKERARQLVQHYDLVQFQNLLQVCTECLASIDQNEHELAFGMRLVMEVLAENHELFPDVVKIYIKENTPYSVRPDEILRSLFTMMPPLDVKGLITSYDFAEKDAWLWAFYAELPENAISIAWVEDFLLYLQFPSKSLHTAPYRPLYQLKKYECVDKDIILKSSRIISEHYEDSPFIFSLYFFDTINPYGTDSAEVIKQYKDDISLLEDVYLKYIMYSKNEDLEGKLLSEIIRKDPEFLISYLDRALLQKERFYDYNNPWFSRLYFIWREDSFLDYMNRISNHILSCTKADDLYLRCGSVLDQLLVHREGEEAVYNRQNEWIRFEIEHFWSDEERMYELFSGISGHGADRRRHALKIFLTLNSDYEAFKNLPLESLTYGGWGSMIPYIEKRIEYLTSLLPMLSGLQFLKHKQKIEHKIEMWKRDIQAEEIRELLESFS